MSKIKFLSVMIFYLCMQAQVSVAGIRLDNVSSVEVKKSVKELTDTATVTIPATATLQGFMPIKNFVKVGDEIAISLGYFTEDGTIEPEDGIAVEFRGFVTEISADVPLVLSCDNMYELRKSNITQNFKNTTLKKVLEQILPAGYTFETYDVSLGNYVVENASAFDVLAEVQQKYGLFCRLDGNHLRVKMAYDYASPQTHSYYLNGSNCNVKKNELVYRSVEQRKLRIKAISKLANGSEISVWVGNKYKDASERTLHFFDITSESELKKIAEAELAKASYDGFDGTVSGFGTPRTNPGDVLNIVNPENERQNGSYMIEEVQINYSSSAGFERVNTLGFKLNIHN